MLNVSEPVGIYGALKSEAGAMIDRYHVILLIALIAENILLILELLLFTVWIFVHSTWCTVCRISYLVSLVNCPPSPQPRWNQVHIHDSMSQVIYSMHVETWPYLRVSLIKWQDLKRLWWHIWWEPQAHASCTMHIVVHIVVAHNSIGRQHTIVERGLLKVHPCEWAAAGWGTRVAAICGVRIAWGSTGGWHAVRDWRSWIANAIGLWQLALIDCAAGNNHCNVGICTREHLNVSYTHVLFVEVKSGSLSKLWRQQLHIGIPRGPALKEQMHLISTPYHTSFYHWRKAWCCIIQDVIYSTRGKTTHKTEMHCHQSAPVCFLPWAQLFTADTTWWCDLILSLYLCVVNHSLCIQ